MTPDELADELDDERNREYWAPSFWCKECGRPEYVGSPENECQVCGAQRAGIS